jgi:23S rRNA U2552 (ribose-2'-O)-methylase RlmE/FtsJ
MNFFNLNPPYKKPLSSSNEFNCEMIDFQFTPGGQACECITSRSVYNHLCAAKQTIETCNSEEWDEMKKVTNPYEYIHTSVTGYKYPVSRFKPISRSFYKMIEIVKQCKLFASLPSYRLPPSSSSSTSSSSDDSTRRDYHPPYHHVSSYEYNNSHHQYHRSHSYGNGYNRYVYHDRPANRYTQKHYHQQPNGFYKHHPITVINDPDPVPDPDHTNHVDTTEAVTQVRPVPEAATVNVNVNVTENVNETENENENENTDTGIRSFHLAEGPGGFIEAICYLRANANDVYYGMTLIDDTPNSACPGWKKSRLFLEKNPSVKLEYGKDGTGNLLSIDNYLHCCEKYRNSMDLITADGGFDFSSDFNHQEVLAQTLVVSEVLYALSLQKMGGSFVIKIFDTFTRVTVDIIHLLALFYTDVIIIKPNTSRVANSEKYIVCKGFKLPSNMDQVIETFSTFFKKLQSASAATATSMVSVGAILKSPELHKLHIVHRIEEVNAILGQQQIENIINTMGLVHEKSSDRIDAYKKSHIQKCIEWCERYNIPYNKQSVSTNTFISSTTA